MRSGVHRRQRWKSTRLVAVAVGIGLLGSVTGCAAPQTYRYRQLVMGVETTVSVVAEDERAATDAGRLAFARLAELEQAMSDYRPTSELLQLCETDHRPVTVSADLLEVLVRADEMRQASEGLFDISVGPLTLLWRDARKRGRFPSDEAIAEARARSGGDLIGIDAPGSSVTLGRSGMRLDLGGIGKGYAAAKTIASLRAAGHGRALIAIAGDIAAGEPPPGKSGWSVDIEMPDGSRETLLLHHQSISTSGDREQFLERDGVRYSHLLDPRTGLGATTQRQVTVVGADGAVVDALSSALSIADEATLARLRARYEPNYRIIVWQARGVSAR
jgi:thiamine biosynthesis lipoprotein